MVDNFDFTPGSGKTGAADEINGVLFPRVKIVLGVDNTDDGDVAGGNPMPVDGSAVTQPVSAATLPLPSGAATSTKQLADNHSVTVSNPTADPETGLATSIKQLADNHSVTVSNPTADPETGLATSTKQLADNHSVTVSNPTADPETGLATSTNQLADGHNVALTNKSIIGAADPDIDSYITADVNLVADTPNQEVIATPGANKQIWVYGLIGSTDVAGSISIQDDVDAAHSGIFPLAQYSGPGLQPSGNFSMPWIKVATNKALEIDTVTCAFDGIITYAIVSV